MQDQQKFLEIITNPYQLDKNTLDFLQKISDQYPYSQSVQVLLAKNIQEFDKLEFEKQVNKASAYSIDRRKFQRYISEKDKNQSAKIAENLILSQVADQDQKKQTKPENIGKEHKQSLLEIVRKRLRDISERKQTEPKEPKQNEKGVFNDLTEQKQETPLTDIPDKTENIGRRENIPANELTFEVDWDQLQQSDKPFSFAPERYKKYQRAFAENTKEEKKTDDLQEFSESPEQGIAQKKEEQTNVVREETTQASPDAKKETTELPGENNTSPEVSQEKSKEQHIGEPEDTKEKTDHDFIKEGTPESFNEIEKQKKENKKTEIDTEESNKEIKTTEIDQTIEQDIHKETVEKKIHSPETSFERVKGLHRKKPDINELIDKFLKEEPRIKVQKDLPDGQEDLSAPSTSEDPQLATETLANVYLKQGNKKKALDIYEKLCLKFPQKSSYFAKKIIEIKNELNS